MARTRVPLETVADEYIRGTEVDGRIVFPTYADLAAKYHCSESQLRQYGAKQSWTERRHEHRQALYEAIVRTIDEEHVQKAVAFDQVSIDLALDAMQMAMEHLQDARKRSVKLPLSSLRLLGQTASSLQRVGRLAVGKTTENVETQPVDQKHNDFLAYATDEELAQFETFQQTIAERIEKQHRAQQ